MKTISTSTRRPIRRSSCFPEFLRTRYPRLPSCVRRFVKKRGIHFKLSFFLLHSSSFVTLFGPIYPRAQLRNSVKTNENRRRRPLPSSSICRMCGRKGRAWLGQGKRRRVGTLGRWNENQPLQPLPSSSFPPPFAVCLHM